MWAKILLLVFTENSLSHCETYIYTRDDFFNDQGIFAIFPPGMKETNPRILGILYAFLIAIENKKFTWCESCHVVDS